jgi:hypothetical protein
MEDWGPEKVVASPLLHKSQSNHRAESKTHVLDPLFWIYSLQKALCDWCWWSHTPQPFAHLSLPIALPAFTCLRALSCTLLPYAAARRITLGVWGSWHLWATLQRMGASGSGVLTLRLFTQTCWVQVLPEVALINYSLLALHSLFTVSLSSHPNNPKQTVYSQLFISGFASEENQN